jgi:hypothetical protein
MGREIRRVPADWDHPRQQCPHSPWAGGCSEAKQSGQCFRPLYDESFESAAAEWKEGYAKWESGDDPDRAENPDDEFWEWHGAPPNREYYRPDWPEESAIHYQVYETVSEGTPVTPHFATRVELIDYLVSHGDYWDQSRTREGRARVHGPAKRPQHLWSVNTRRR